MQAYGRQAECGSENRGNDQYEIGPSLECGELD